MNNQEQIQAQKFVKAATAGFTTTLSLKGYTPEMMKDAAVMYSHPERGMLAKRAHAYRSLQKRMLKKFASITQRWQEKAAAITVATK